MGMKKRKFEKLLEEYEKSIINEKYYMSLDAKRKTMRKFWETKKKEDEYKKKIREIRKKIRRKRERKEKIKRIREKIKKLWNEYEEYKQKEREKRKRKIQMLEKKKNIKDIKKMIKKREKLYKKYEKYIRKERRRVFKRMVYDLVITYGTLKQKLEESKLKYHVEKYSWGYKIIDVEKRREYKVKFKELRNMEEMNRKKKILVKKVVRYILNRYKDRIIRKIMRDTGVSKAKAKKILKRFSRVGKYILTYLSEYA